MPRRSFRFLEIGAFCALAYAPSSAFAQPCCAGASALTPARLALHETALVGIQARVTDIFGSFDGGRRFIAASAGSREIDIEEDLVGSVRFRKAQASLLLPIDQTYRRVPGISEVGGGVGDTQVSLRYDFFEAGVSKRIPGVALLGALTFPTGRATENAATPLATGATGTGAFQAALAASFEQSFGPVLLDLTGSTTWRAARTVEALHTQDGVLFTASTAVAYSFDPGPVIAASFAYSAALPTSIDSVRVKDGGKSQSRVGLSGGYTLTDHLRAQGVLFTDLPARYLGQNEPAGVGGSFIFIRSWL